METAAPGTAPPKSNAWKYLVGACCGCALLGVIAFVLLGAGIFYTVNQLTAPAKAQVNVFLRSMSTGNDAAAYDTFSVKLKAIKTQEWVKGIMQERAEFFKIPPDQGPSYSNQQMKNGEVYLRGSYPVAGGQTVYCKFRLIPEGNTWKIVELDIKPEDFPPEPGEGD